MTPPKYGLRYSCFQCGTKFFDMNKPKPLCPKCGADQKKAPKKPASRQKHVVAPEEFPDAIDDEPMDEDLHDFPIKSDDDEPRFDPDHDHLSIDDMPEDDL
ncbi:MAG: FYDLN acid domain-containing protein [Nitrospinota bacterium]|nr:FYDLN acid domain-containing protein [Nitrospinota bacterium]